MQEQGNDRLLRLREEYNHTLGLLRSPRLTATTRKVLEALKADLERQVSEEENRQRPLSAAD